MFIDIYFTSILNITVLPFWEIFDELSGWESDCYFLFNPLWFFEEITLGKVAILVYCISC